MTTRRNADPSLVELRARTEVRGEQHSLHAELRIGSSEIATGDDAFVRVSVKRVDVMLDMDGVDVVAGSRFGEPNRTDANIVKTVEKRETTNSFKVGAEGTGQFDKSGGDGKIIGSGGVKHEQTNTKTRHVEIEEKQQYVTARGGDKWEVVEPNEGKLDGTYLTDDHGLCCLQRTKGANRKCVTITTEVRQRDLLFDKSADRLLSKLTPNRERLVNILLAKAAAVGLKQDFVGKIALSELEIED